MYTILNAYTYIDKHTYMHTHIHAYAHTKYSHIYVNMQHELITHLNDFPANKFGIIMIVNIICTILAAFLSLKITV